MTRSIDVIDQIVLGLQARVNQLDGSNLPDATQSTVAQLRRDITGLRSTLEQVSLGMEADRQRLEERVSQLEVLVSQHLGVS